MTRPRPAWALALGLLAIAPVVSNSGLVETGWAKAHCHHAALSSGYCPEFGAMTPGLGLPPFWANAGANGAMTAETDG